jgi:hypothetical protein
MESPLSHRALYPSQVLRLCEAHRLYTALAYVYNRIREYRRPLLVLLAAVAMPPPPLLPPPDTRESASAANLLAVVAPSSSERLLPPLYKLLVYMRCVFRGRAFPPGSTGGGGRGFFAGSSAVEEDPSNEPRAQVLRFKILSLLGLELLDPKPKP